MLRQSARASGRIASALRRRWGALLVGAGCRRRPIVRRKGAEPQLTTVRMQVLLRPSRAVGVLLVVVEADAVACFRKVRMTTLAAWRTAASATTIASMAICRAILHVEIASPGGHRVLSARTARIAAIAQLGRLLKAPPRGWGLVKRYGRAVRGQAGQAGWGYSGPPGGPVGAVGQSGVLAPGGALGGSGSRGTPVATRRSHL